MNVNKRKDKQKASAAFDVGVEGVRRKAASGVVRARASRAGWRGMSKCFMPFSVVVLETPRNRRVLQLWIYPCSFLPFKFSSLLILSFVLQFSFSSVFPRPLSNACHSNFGSSVTNANGPGVSAGNYQFLALVLGSWSFLCSTRCALCQRLITTCISAGKHLSAVL